MFAIKFIRTRALGTGADEADLDWRPVTGHADYADEAEAWAACDEFDAAFDHEYTHRPFAVANDNEEA